MARATRPTVSQRRLQAALNMCAALLLLLAAGARRVDAAGFREILFPLMTQTDAKASCVAQGGFLAKLSASNLQEVTALISRGRFTIIPQENVTSEKWSWRHAAWMGAEDRATEGEFLWQDGSAASDAPWAPGEPNSNGDQDCAMLANWEGYPWLSSWQLWDWSCESTLRFVCQIDSLDANEVATVTSKEATNASVAKTEEERLAGGALVGVVVVHPAPCGRDD